MFSSYHEHPTNVRFEGQDEDEKIILLLRSHPVTNLSWILWALFLMFLPVFLPAVIFALGFGDPFNLPAAYYNGFLVINYLLVTVIIFEGFLYWFFNVYIVTNKRVIDITFTSLLLKNVDLAPLENIEEANSSITGFLGTIFNFGNVAIQTAGANIAIHMIKIPNPVKVADFILDRTKNNAN